MGDDVEVKVLVLADGWPRLRDAAQLEEPTLRSVWFLETAQRILGAQGVILRIRAGASSGDTTAKLRGHPLVRDLVEVFDQEEGFKAETDCSEGSSVLAFSITRDDPGLADGSAPMGLYAAPRDRFSRHQRGLVALAAGCVPWDELRLFGPIASQSWKKKKLGIAIERWTVGDDSIVEVSMRGTDPAQQLQQLDVLLAGWQVPSAGIPGGKTRWALERLAAG